MLNVHGSSAWVRYWGKVHEKEMRVRRKTYEAKRTQEREMWYVEWSSAAKSSWEVFVSFHDEPSSEHTEPEGGKERKEKQVVEKENNIFTKYTQFSSDAWLHTRMHNILFSIVSLSHLVRSFVVVRARNCNISSLLLFFSFAPWSFFSTWFHWTFSIDDVVLIDFAAYSPSLAELFSIKLDCTSCCRCACVDMLCVVSIMIFLQKIAMISLCSRRFSGQRKWTRTKWRRTTRARQTGSAGSIMQCWENYLTLARNWLLVLFRSPTLRLPGLMCSLTFVALLRSSHRNC